MRREAVFEALFALVSEGEGLPGRVTWNQGQDGFAYTSRRVRPWDDVPAQPALMQAEHEEELAQVSGLPPKRTLKAAWMVYHQAGADSAAIPAIVTNQVLDALEAALAPDDPSGACTLGGLVHHCFLDGKVFKASGDLDGQALVVAPITLLLP